jgi:hypothetical protein
MEVSLQEFNDRVRLVNHLLEGMCVGDDNIRLRRHYSRAKRLGPDGIHIDKDALHKYYWKSVKGALKAVLDGELRDT